MTYAIYIFLAFFAVSGVTYYLMELRARRQEQKSRQHIQRLTERIRQQPFQAEREARNQAAREAAMNLDRLPALTKLLSGSEFGQRLRLEMVRAGLRLRPAEFVAICITLVLALFTGALSQTHQALPALMIGSLGLVGPVMLLRQKQQARRRLFDSQIPDALTLVASSMRSGYSFLRALKMVEDEMPAPISEEVAWALGETALGVPMEIALNRMVERTRSADMELVVIAVNIQSKVGGNLAQIFDTITETMRERVRIQGEIKSLTAEGKLSGIILFLLPIFLGVVLQIRDPQYFKPLIESSVGTTMIIGALVLQVLGGIVIKKMVTLDV
jgi:tight adherence protein B